MLVGMPGEKNKGFLSLGEAVIHRQPCVAGAETDVAHHPQRGVGGTWLGDSIVRDVVDLLIPHLDLFGSYHSESISNDKLENLSVVRLKLGVNL